VFIHPAGAARRLTSGKARELIELVRLTSI
jgi:hypothetical protein